MCFSAEASFAASGLLMLLGLGALYKNHHKHYTLFASIPLIFGVQQLSEGILWHSLSHQSHWPSWLISISTYTFLSFAFIFWPILIPLSVVFIEKKDPRKDLLAIPLAIGVTFGLSMLTHFLYFGARAYIQDHHIVYDIYLPSSFWVPGTIAYLIATITPFVFIRNWKMMLFGAGLAGSYLVTYFYFYTCLISVWCFFAALLSLGVILIV